VAPGEVIWLKPYEEILGTLDTQNKNRGLYFDAEEVPIVATHTMFDLVSKRSSTSEPDS